MFGEIIKKIASNEAEAEFIKEINVLLNDR